MGLKDNVPFEKFCVENYIIFVFASELP